MLTRLRVKGFKNLVDVDVHFGPLTCIAGENGVGKSNLLDAIFFLSQLADKPLLEAAMSVRDEAGRTSDVRSIFHRVGDRYADEISFDVEMIVPAEGIDDLGQPVKATTTFLTYGLTVGFRSNGAGPLELRREELHHIPKRDAHKHLLFPHGASTWRRSVVTGEGTGHRTAPFISTTNKDGARIVQLHQDGQGRPRPLRAQSLPRTVLSTANAAEGPTVTLARREMQSWRLLQLEPSSLRRPSSFQEPPSIGVDGSHMAACLFRLARTPISSRLVFLEQAEAQVYSQVANRLSSLLGDVKRVWVDRDEKRELFTLMVEARDGTPYPARALSDGTLRFLALSILAEDPQATGLLCMEEPENGIHPSRIGTMLELLRSIAVDPQHVVEDENPQRQVILNTHSPVVVSQMNLDEVLFAYREPYSRSDHQGIFVRFSALSLGRLAGTWRDQTKSPLTPRGVLLDYVSPFALAREDDERRSLGKKRVAELTWVQEEIDFGVPS